MKRKYKTNIKCAICKEVKPRLKLERHGKYKDQWTCIAKWNDTWKACSQEISPQLKKELFDGMF